MSVNSLSVELRESCHTSDENAVKQLLKDGADPNDCDKVSSALHEATRPSTLIVFHHTHSAGGIHTSAHTCVMFLILLTQTHKRYSAALDNSP